MFLQIKEKIDYSVKIKFAADFQKFLKKLYWEKRQNKVEQEKKRILSMCFSENESVEERCTVL